MKNEGIPASVHAIETQAMLSSLKERAVKEEEILSELTTLMREIETIAKHPPTQELTQASTDKMATFMRLVDDFYGDGIGDMQEAKRISFISQRMNSIRHTMNTLLDRKALPHEKVTEYLSAYVDRVKRFVALLERRDVVATRHKK